MSDDVTNGIGPDTEQIVRGIENLRQWDNGWRDVVLTGGLVTTLTSRRGTEVPIFGMAIDRDPVGPNVPYAFTAHATRELENNTPEVGCWECQHTIAGARTCRREAHGYTAVEAALWTRERYESINHLTSV